MNTLTSLGLVVAWLPIMLGGWLAWQLVRQNGRMLLRLDELEKRQSELKFGEGEAPTGLPVGSEAPGFELPDLSGDLKSFAQFSGRQTLMIFFNPECGFCRELAPKLTALCPHTDGLSNHNRQGNGESRPLILLVTAGDEEKNRQFFTEHKVDCPVLLQKDGEVAKAYQANGTPAGYLISPGGKIASQLAMGSEALLALASGRSVQPSTPNPQALVQDDNAPPPANGDQSKARFSARSLAHSRIKRDGLKAGTLTPEFRLPRLDGRGDLALSELRGKRVLLVFSSPTCGPCNTLAPELQKFHSTHSEPEVVMVSKGEPNENRAKVKEYGLTFPIVLQQQFEISRRYAMFATPVAYLIDEAGIIAADVAVGNEAILDLMSRAKEVFCQQPRPALA
jgi:peroxiredoxin